MEYKKPINLIYTAEVSGESTYYYDDKSERLLPSTTHRDYDLLGNLIREEKPEVSLYNNVYRDLQRGRNKLILWLNPSQEQELNRWEMLLRKP